MEYTKLTMGSYNLHIIKTNKFKTITVDVNFRRPIVKEEITKRNLLKEILLNSTKKYNTKRKLVLETENLYDIKISSATVRIGNYTNLSFTMKMLSEKYTKDKLYEDSLLFLFEILFNPNVENMAFLEENVNEVKEILKNSIMSLKDNKSRYAIIKMFENMADDLPFSYNPYGSIEEMEKESGNSLYEYYKNILSSDLIDVFIVGDVDADITKELFMEYFKVNTFKKEQKEVISKEKEARNRIKKVEIKDNSNQANVVIGCMVNGMTDFERRYVLRVFNEIFGGNSNSKLFSTVREKNSLCYTIYSDPKPYDNVLFIYLGTEKTNVDKVLKLTKKALSEMQKGNFDDDSLKNSKETLISSINRLEDTQGGIINNYFGQVMLNSDNFEIKREKINEVTKEACLNLAKKVKLDTMLILGGDGSDKN